LPTNPSTAKHDVEITGLIGTLPPFFSFIYFGPNPSTRTNLLRTGESVIAYLRGYHAHTYHAPTPCLQAQLASLCPFSGNLSALPSCQPCHQPPVRADKEIYFEKLKELEKYCASLPCIQGG
jgi:hypothetical protein